MQPSIITVCNCRVRLTSVYVKMETDRKSEIADRYEGDADCCVYECEGDIAESDEIHIKSSDEVSMELWSSS